MTDWGEVFAAFPSVPDLWKSYEKGRSRKVRLVQKHPARGRLSAGRPGVDNGHMDVLTALRSSPHPLSDDDLAQMLGRDLRSVSHECRGLAFRGLVIREQQGSGPIMNIVSIGDS